MQTTWNEGGRSASGDRAALAHRVRVRAGCDARRVLTPQLRLDQGDTRAAAGRPRRRQEPPRRLGPGAGLRTARQRTRRTSTIRRRSKDFFATVQALHAQGRILAYHDRSDGGLFATLAEMAFAARCGLAIALDELPGAGRRGAVQRGAGRGAAGSFRRSRTTSSGAFEAAGLRCVAIGEPDRRASACAYPATATAAVRRIARRSASRLVAHDPCVAEAARSIRMRRDQEYERLLDVGDPGLRAAAHFRSEPGYPPRHSLPAARPRVAILREQGVNGQVEMAAAFDRAGFDALRRAHERHHCADGRR